MTKELDIFTSAEFGTLRTIEENGKIMFVASDVAKMLGYSNVRDAILRHCKGVVKHDTPTNGGVQAINFIPEGDVYRLIVHSKLPAAEKFESWVFDEVLPSIRKTGSYSIMPNFNNPAEAARAWANEYEAKQKALAKVKEMKPKVLFAEAVESSKTSILVGELAKIIKQNGVDIGEKRFFAWLRDNGYLISRKSSDWNMPTQRSMKLGLFEIKERNIFNPDGSVRITKTPKVTGKGQTYFISKFLKEIA